LRDVRNNGDDLGNNAAALYSDGIDKYDDKELVED
jgi:hypothetical protein